jgi:bifunctional non-homologous end joining protein LigD
MAHALASRLARAEPKRFTDTAAKTVRRGRIFVDYLRNTRGATAVAPFSPRARPGATIAMPLGWHEVKTGLDPARWTIRATRRELQAAARAWGGYAAAADGQSLTIKAARRLGLRD